MKHETQLFALQLFADGAQGEADASAPEASAPKAAAPKTVAPEASAPEASVQPGQASAPEANAPETAAPEASAQPEQTAAPEASAQPGQASAPEASAQPGQASDPRDTPQPGRAPGRDVRAHFASLQAQAAQLQKTFPGFSLLEELKNPTLLRMTAPDVNIPLADAYYAVHHKELQAAAMQVTAQKTAQKLAASIRSGALRPDEGGGAQAPSVSTFSYASASRHQREALKQKIRLAAAQGKRIYPMQG